VADVCVEPLGTQVRREGLSSFAGSLRRELAGGLRCELHLSAFNESRRGPSEYLPSMQYMLGSSFGLC
jgi:hypothetical protein